MLSKISFGTFLPKLLAGPPFHLRRLRQNLFHPDQISRHPLPPQHDPLRGLSRNRCPRRPLLRPLRPRSLRLTQRSSRRRCQHRRQSPNRRSLRPHRRLRHSGPHPKQARPGLESPRLSETSGHTSLLPRPSSHLAWPWARDPGLIKTPGKWRGQRRLHTLSRHLSLSSGQPLNLRHPKPMGRVGSSGNHNRKCGRTIILAESSWVITRRMRTGNGSGCPLVRRMVHLRRRTPHFLHHDEDPRQRWAGSAGVVYRPLHPARGSLRPWHPGTDSHWRRASVLAQRHTGLAADVHVAATPTAYHRTNYEFSHRVPMRKLGWTEREARCLAIWRFQIGRRLTGRRSRVEWCSRGADRTPALRSNAIRRRRWCSAGRSRWHWYRLRTERYRRAVGLHEGRTRFASTADTAGVMALAPISAPGGGPAADALFRIADKGEVRRGAGDRLSGHRRPCGL